MTTTCPTCGLAVFVTLHFIVCDEGCCMEYARDLQRNMIEERRGE